MNGKNLFAGFLGVFLTLICSSEIHATSRVSQERFQWRGQVDGIDEVLIRGASVSVRHLAAKPIQRQDYRFTAPLPSRDVDLELHKIEGRGDVELIEEPTSWNDYTAVVRVDDSDKIGDSYYEFELTWTEGDDWGDWGGRDEPDPWDNDADSDQDDEDWYRVWDQEGGAFSWEGRVDIGAEIRLRGGEHEIRDVGGQGTQEYRSRFTSDLPLAEVPFSLRQIEGRGRVELIQTPSADNDYTAVVRIEDPSSGEDTYEFELTWRKE